MTTLVIIVLLLMIVMTGCVAAIIIDELVKNRKASPATVPQTETEPVAATDNTTANVATVANTAPATPAPTHEEKYNNLPDDARSWYDEIAQYAMAIDGAKRALRKRYEEFTLGNTRIAQLSIDSKGVTVCAFVLRNSAFFTYASENEIAVSTPATKIKITGDGTVAAAKRAVDMVVKNIEEEKALMRRIEDQRRERDKAQNTQNNDDQGDA